MNEENYTKKYVQKIGKVLFGSFGVFIGIAVMSEVILLYVTDKNYFKYIFSPLVALTVIIVSAPILWKYMK